MKYVFKKLRLMQKMYAHVRDDECRKKELLGAYCYIAKHPSLFFKKKRFEGQLDSVMKNVNTIVNRPYYEELYELVWPSR